MSFWVFGLNRIQLPELAVFEIPYHHGDCFGPSATLRKAGTMSMLNFSRSLKRFECHCRIELSMGVDFCTRTDLLLSVASYPSGIKDLIKIKTSFARGMEPRSCFAWKFKTRTTSTSDESIIAVPLTRDPVRNSSERDSFHGFSFGAIRFKRFAIWRKTSFLIDSNSPLVLSSSTSLLARLSSFLCELLTLLPNR